MKKNFLVTTALPDAWEPDENNFILGKWCELHEFANHENKKKFENKIKKKINIIKNNYHWDDSQKRNKDYKYLSQINEKVLEIVSENLSKIHNLHEDIKYWRVILEPWLCAHISTIFDRWENIRLFFEKNNTDIFYSNELAFKDLQYISKNHMNYIENTQKDEWNHLLYLRLLEYFKNKNIKLIKKNNIYDVFPEDKRNTPFPSYKNQPILAHIFRSLDSFISGLAFKYNKVIFENFHFPKIEYFKLCLKNKLIPAKYLNTFNFKINSDNAVPNNKIRKEFKNLFLQKKYNKEFMGFVLDFIYKDIPMSYLEDYHIIKEKILPMAKNKKIIFSMFSIYYNDNFKTYVAETKKYGSKIIISKHGAGPTFDTASFLIQDPYFNFLEKIADKIILWSRTNLFDNFGKKIEKSDFHVQLSPTLPIIKFKRKKAGKFCTFVFYEPRKYINNFITGPGLSSTIQNFNYFGKSLQKLNPNIKLKIKFRVKELKALDLENQFIKSFGEKSIDRPSGKNTFIETLQNSKLIVVTTPNTAFAEALYSNTPTILISKKKEWTYSTTGLKIVENLLKNKIIFEDYEDAIDHVNKNWDRLDEWWNDTRVQYSRKLYLRYFFHSGPYWYKGWSDYVNFLLSME